MFSFFTQFIRKPHETGAIAPTGTALSQLIVQLAHVESAQTIVELGPGTGPFTREIVARKPATATFIAVESNPVFCATLKERFPEVCLFNQSAAELPSILASQGITSCDAIVCGLPWAAFGHELQTTTLEAVYASLKQGGIFVTFTYIQSPLLPAGKAFAKRLAHTFASVECSHIVWRNLPPAFVYICRK